MLIQGRVEICLGMISEKIPYQKIILNNLRARAQKDTRSTRFTSRDSLPRHSAPSSFAGLTTFLAHHQRRGEKKNTVGFSYLLSRNPCPFPSAFCLSGTWCALLLELHSLLIIVFTWHFLPRPSPFSRNTLHWGCECIDVYAYVQHTNTHTQTHSQRWTHTHSQTHTARKKIENMHGRIAFLLMVAGSCSGRQMICAQKVDFKSSIIFAKSRSPAFNSCEFNSLRILFVCCVHSRVWLNGQTDVLTHVCLYAGCYLFLGLI
jgi:hypothetical protein